MADAAGNVINQTQYKAWGEERYSSGAKQTSYGYTGQYSDSYINFQEISLNPSQMLFKLLKNKAVIKFEAEKT